MRFLVPCFELAWFYPKLQLGMPASHIRMQVWISAIVLPVNLISCYVPGKAKKYDSGPWGGTCYPHGRPTWNLLSLEYESEDGMSLCVFVPPSPTSNHSA